MRTYGRQAGPVHTTDSENPNGLQLQHWTLCVWCNPWAYFTDRFMQVPSSKLPHYRDVLEPLLPLDGARSIHTKDFKDGQRIPTLSELLEAVGHRLLSTQHSLLSHHQATSSAQLGKPCRRLRTRTSSWNSGTRTLTLSGGLQPASERQAESTE